MLSTGDDLINLIILVLDNASVASESEELRQCLALWRRVQEGGGGGAWRRAGGAGPALSCPPLGCLRRSPW